MELTQQLLDIPIEHMSNVFGKFDAWLKQIEKYLQVTMVVRDGSLKIMGEDKNVEAAQKVLTELLAMSQRGNDITEQTVTYALEMCGYIQLCSRKPHRHPGNIRKMISKQYFCIFTVNLTLSHAIPDLLLCQKFCQKLRGILIIAGYFHRPDKA